MTVCDEIDQTQMLSQRQSSSVVNGHFDTRFVRAPGNSPLIRCHARKNKPEVVFASLWIAVSDRMCVFLFRHGNVTHRIVRNKMRPLDGRVVGSASAAPKVPTTKIVDNSFISILISAQRQEVC